MTQGTDPIQYFLTLFPEFKKKPRETIIAYLDIATMRVPPSVWRSAAPYATALLAAHMLATSGPSGGGSAGGPVTQEAVGDLSRSYGTVSVPGSGDAELETTRYGIDFVALRKSTILVGRSILSARRRPAGCY